MDPRFFRKYADLINEAQEEDFKRRDEDEDDDDTEQLDELSQDTLGSYVKKAKQDREQSYSSAKNRYDIGDSDAVVKANQRMQKRQDGMNTAYGKMNKLDELSQDTLGSYANKAGKDRDNEIAYANSRYDIGDHDSAQVGMQRARKRQDGIDTAARKINKVAESRTKRK